MKEQEDRRAGHRCEPPGRKLGAGGFSLFEFLVAAVVLAAVATFLLGRLAHYEEEAEKAQAELVISQLKSLLRLRIASLMVEGKMQEVRHFAGKNPMEWLETPPPNYIGTAEKLRRTEIKPGVWYFEQATGELVYVVKNGASFEPDSAGLKRIRLRLSSVPNLNQSSNQASSEQGMDTVMLELVDKYRWF